MEAGLVLKFILAALAIIAVTGLAFLAMRSSQVAVPQGSERPSETSSMASDLAGLEQQKLQLEIRNLRWAWLPSSLPIVLGLLTLGIGWWSGLFETRSQLLEMRRERLERDVATFQVQRAEVSKDVDTLRAELDELKVQNARLEEVRVETLKKLGSTPVETLIAELGVEPDERSEFLSAIAGQLLNKREAAEPIVLRMIGNPKTNPRMKALLAFSVALAFPGEPIHLDRLFETLSDIALSESPDGDALAILGSSRWETGPRKTEIVNRGVTLIARCKNPDTISWIVLMLSRHQGSFERWAQPIQFKLHIAATAAYGQLIKTAIPLALGRGNSYNTRTAAFRALGNLSPTALLVTIARLATPMDVSTERDFLSLKQELKVLVLKANGVLGGSARGPEPPAGDDYDGYGVHHWGKWASDHGELMTVWSDPSLQSVLANPETAITNLRGAYDK